MDRRLALRLRHPERQILGARGLRRAQRPSPPIAKAQSQSRLTVLPGPRSAASRQKGPEKGSIWRANQYVAARNRLPKGRRADLPGSARGQPFGKKALKVIASSIRKGNVIEQDGKLYVVLSAENIHPGKGTPVSQIEMRRIGDGVKVSERYKTTDQVEKATVEERNFTYLYEDGDGYHFMNPETYDQVQVPKDLVGEGAEL